MKELYETITISNIEGRHVVDIQEVTRALGKRDRRIAALEAEIRGLENKLDVLREFLDLDKLEAMFRGGKNEKVKGSY